jgi:hypothetical protein
VGDGGGQVDEVPAGAVGGGHFSAEGSVVGGSRHESTPGAVVSTDGSNHTPGTVAGGSSHHPRTPGAVGPSVTLRTREATQCSEGHNGGEGGDKRRAKHSLSHSRLRPHLKVSSSPVGYDDGSFGHVMATQSMHHVPARSGPWGVEIWQQMGLRRHIPTR